MFISSSARLGGQVKTVDHLRLRRTIFTMKRFLDALALVYGKNEFSVFGRLGERRSRIGGGADANMSNFVRVVLSHINRVILCVLV